MAATWLVLCLVLTQNPGQEPSAGAERSLAEKFAELKQRFETREKAFEVELRAANKLGEEARWKKVEDENDAFQRDWHAMEDEVRKLIRSHPDDPAALEGIILLPGTMRSFLDDDLVKLVRKRFLNDPRMGRLCEPLVWRSEDWSGALLKDVSARHPDGEVRGQATLAYGLWWRYAAEELARPDDQPGEEVEKFLDSAKRCFEQVVNDYSDVKSTDGKYLLADRARAELARIENLPNLKVGKVAPEIEGEDLEGNPLKLSDHRGKVVVVCFWATWCGPCMAMVPHERELVAKHRDQPFVLLGVNSDEPGDREKARATTREKQMTWRSWWDGDVMGPIQTSYNVHHWPTVYVLDSRGVIRYIDARDEELDRAVETLLVELEGEARPEGASGPR